MPPDLDGLAEIVNEAQWRGLFDRAAEEQAQRLAADPEWSTPKYVHVHRLVEAFAVGVISADAWHRGYTLPHDFVGVVNWIAFNIQREWPNEEVVQLSLIDIKQRLHGWAMEHPSYRAWNDLPGSGIVTRYSETPSSREFIDLDVPPHNAALHIRQHHRECEAFDAKFRAEHEAEHPGWFAPRASAPATGEARAARQGEP